MTVSDGDEVLERLAALSVAPPPGLSDRVITRWLVAPSPIGQVFVAFTGVGVQFVQAADAVHGDPEAFAEVYRRRFARPLRRAQRAPRELLPALRGRAASPSLDLGGLSDFERAVLAATRRIPPGETRPYGWIAREAGRPAAVRAAGSALARNPVPLLIPCHRVVRADGRIGDYAFGASRKEELLRGEQVDVDQLRALAAAGVRYLGSDTTGVVCFPTCSHARRISASHRHGFARVAIAIEAGYRPCRHCRPAPVGPGEW